MIARSQAWAYEQIRPNWLVAGGDTVSNTLPMQEVTILHNAKQLYLPTLGEKSARMAEEAIKKKQLHLSYMEALLENSGRFQPQKCATSPQRC